MTTYPKPLFQLIQLLKKLPGVGQKTAERYAFQLIDWKLSELKLLGLQISQLKDLITQCKECGTLKETVCNFCSKESRKNGALCIVSNPKDVFSIEETRMFSGLYYVLPTILNPFDGEFEKQINLTAIIEYIQTNNIKEIILAVESTLEGDATALYLKEELTNLGLTMSRLAYGIPLGSTLEYIDGGTLSKALMGRQPF